MYLSANAMLSGASTNPLAEDIDVRRSLESWGKLKRVHKFYPPNSEHKNE